MSLIFDSQKTAKCSIFLNLFNYPDIWLPGSDSVPNIASIWSLFKVRQSVEDADTLIVSTAIDLAGYFATVIIGEDTDLLTILTAKAPNSSNIYVVKPGKGTFSEHILVSQVLQLLGCCQIETTDMQYVDLIHRLHSIAKFKFVKLLEKNTTLQKRLSTILGSPLFISGRWDIWTKSASRYFQNLTSLPPTIIATAHHILRVYLQFHSWYDRPNYPLSWGWKRTEIGLLPIHKLQGQQNQRKCEHQCCIPTITGWLKKVASLLG